MPCNGLLAIYSHNVSDKNFTEAKIANQLNNVSSVTQYPIQSCLISWPARLAKSWVLQTFYVRFPVLVNHAK